MEPDSNHRGRSEGNCSYVQRFYREQLGRGDLYSLRVVVGESDLFIAFSSPTGAVAAGKIREEITERLMAVRRPLREYIQRRPEFAFSFAPVDVPANAPVIIKEMAAAAGAAGVGPMAAVAGAIAQHIGRYLGTRFPDVIVENGGDIYIDSEQDRVVGVYAGRGSRFSGRLAIKLTRDRFPLGICTSAGTIGPSQSLGVADAAVVLAKQTALADAVATAVGNRVKSDSDLASAVEFGSTIPGVEGIIVIKNDKLAAWGDIEFV